MKWHKEIPKRAIPTHIALLLNEFFKEDNPRVQLYCLIDVMEVMTRWLVAVFVAEISQTNDGQLPEGFQREVYSLISRPTLGSWTKILTEAVRISPRTSDTLDQVRDFVTGDMLPLLGSIDDHEGSIRHLRNTLVHGGGMTYNGARARLVEYTPKFLDLIQSFARAHAKLTVWAVWRGRTYQLNGLKIRAGDPTVPLPAGDGTWLVDPNNRLLPLRPLMTYEPVTTPSESAVPIDAEELEYDEDHAPVPQAYFRLRANHLEYVPLGVDTPVSISLGRSGFQKLFGVKPDTRAGTDVSDDDFRSAALRLAQYRSEEFVGRQEDLADIKRWIKGVRAAGNDTRRVAWIGGQPGIGKSFLMAKAAQNALGAAGPQHQVFFHAFQSGEVYNNRRSFLLNLRQCIESWPGMESGAETRSRMLDGQALETEVKRLLTRLRQIHGGDAWLLGYVDGLDEIANADPHFPLLLLELAESNTVWIVSGRPQSNLEGFIKSKFVHRLVFSRHGTDGGDGLPAMSRADIRTMLFSGSGPRARALLRLDTDDGAAEGGVSNTYLEQVVKRAKGLPIYVHLLLKDISDGTRHIDPNDKLPHSLRGFYTHVLARQGLSDLRTHLGLIACLVAESEEPLDHETLCGLFAQCPGYDYDATRISHWVTQACHAGEAILRSATTPEGVLGFVPYHQSFRDFIRGDIANSIEPAEDLLWALGLARWALVSAANDVTVLSNEFLHRHMLRHGPRYLLAWGDAVVPSKSYASATARVIELTSRPEALEEMYQAWRGNKSGFLFTLNDCYDHIVGRLGAEAAEPIVRALMTMLIRQDTNRPEAIDIEELHAIITYRKNPAFYYSMLDLSVKTGMDTVFVDHRRTALKISFMARQANRLRRAGDLDAALQLLAVCEAAFTEDQSLAPQERARELSRVEYDRGYTYYLKSDLEEAKQHFEKSRARSVEAGDETGEWITRCVMAKRAVQRHLGDDAALRNAVLEFEQVCHEAADVFARIYRSTGDPTAERWIMNVKAHFFETAFLQSDARMTGERLEAYLEDPWVPRYGDPLYASRMRARYLYVNGEYGEAADLFKQSLPFFSSDTDSHGQREEAARDYFDFGWAAFRAGRMEEAREAWETGLRTDERFANRQWKPSLRNALSQII